MNQNFLTPDQLFDFFILEESPYWVLYNARRTREVISRFKGGDGGEMTTDEAMASSWDALHSYLFAHPGGVGKLVLKKSPNANNDKCPTLYVKWGTALNGSGAAAGAVIGTTGGVTSAGGVDPLTERLLKMQEKFYEQRMADQMRVMELLFQSKEQEATIEGLLEPSLQENLIKEGIGVVKTWIAANAARPQAHLGTLGASEHPTTPPPPPAPEPGAPAVPFDGDQAARDIARMQEALPDIPANDVLSKLSAFAAQNPEMAKALLANLDAQTN